MIVKSDTSNASGQFIINPMNIKNIKKLPKPAYYQDEIISFGPVKINAASYVYFESENNSRDSTLYDYIDDLIDAI